MSKKVKLTLNVKHEVSKKDFDYFDLNPQFKCHKHTETTKNGNRYFIKPYDESTLPTVENYLNGHKFKFKRNSWHVKLIKFVWGYDSHDFPFVCNYFWLVVFTLCIFPFYGPFKILGLGLIKLIQLISNAVISINTYYKNSDMYKRRQLNKVKQNEAAQLKKLELAEARYQQMVKLISENKFQRIIPWYKQYRSCTDYVNDLAWDKLYRHIDNSPIGIFKSYYDLQNELTNFKENTLPVKVKRISTTTKTTFNQRRDELNSLIKLIKPLANIIMYSIGVIIGFSILFGIILVLPYLQKAFMYAGDWVAGHVYDIIGIIVAVMLLVISIVVILKIVAILSNTFKSFRLQNTILCKIVNVFKYVINAFVFLIKLVIVKPIVMIWNAIAWIISGIVELFHILKALKSENCPAIEWEEDEQ